MSRLGDRLLLRHYCDRFVPGERSFPPTSDRDIYYPGSDGEPLAETFVHLYALLVTLEVLQRYLEGQQATVLANQFLYHSQGWPKLQGAPDAMVILNVEPGPWNNY